MTTWETVSELENRGFNLYRGTSDAGPDRQLNETLIPSQSQGNPGGFIYTWEDHGPVSVDYGAPTAVRVLDVGAGASLPLALPLIGAGLLALAGLAARRRRG